MLPVPPVIFIVGAVSSVLPDCEMLLAPLTVKPSVVPAVIVPTARLLLSLQHCKSYLHCRSLSRSASPCVTDTAPPEAANDMPLAPDSVPLPITVTPLAFATLNCPPLLASVPPLVMLPLVTLSAPLDVSEAPPPTVTALPPTVAAPVTDCTPVRLIVPVPHCRLAVVAVIEPVPLNVRPDDPVIVDVVAD